MGVRRRTIGASKQSRYASPRGRHSAWLIRQQHAQQRAMDFEMPVVFDEAQFAKLVHEVTDTRPRGADHLGKSFLAEIRDDRLWAAFLSEVGQQEQQPGQPLFG